jgi:hypothetical protein
MNFTIRQLGAIVGGWSIILIALSSWISRILTERFLSKWRRDEQASIEAIRGALASDRLLLESAIKSLQAGHDVNHQKRLTGIDHLWNSVLNLRSKFSGVVFFYGILLPEEYDPVFKKDPAIAASLANIDDAFITDAIRSSEEIESERPYLGETLWLRFFIYRAFLGRLAVLIVDGKRGGRFKDWREDDGARQLLAYVIPPKMINSLLGKSKDVTAVYQAVNSLETLILEEISLIVSGRRSAFESFENAKDLQISLATHIQSRSRSDLPIFRG